jgi:hypothetical protein
MVFRCLLVRRWEASVLGARPGLFPWHWRAAQGFCLQWAVVEGEGRTSCLYFHLCVAQHVVRPCLRFKNTWFHSRLLFSVENRCLLSFFVFSSHSAESQSGEYPAQPLPPPSGGCMGSDPPQMSQKFGGLCHIKSQHSGEACLLRSWSPLTQLDWVCLGGVVTSYVLS